MDKEEVEHLEHWINWKQKCLRKWSRMKIKKIKKKKCRKIGVGIFPSIHSESVINASDLRWLHSESYA